MVGGKHRVSARPHVVLALELVDGGVDGGLEVGLLRVDHEAHPFGLEMKRRCKRKVENDVNAAQQSPQQDEEEEAMMKKHHPHPLPYGTWYANRNIPSTQACPPTPPPSPPPRDFLPS